MPLQERKLADPSTCVSFLLQCAEICVPRGVWGKNISVIALLFIYFFDYILVADFLCSISSLQSVLIIKYVSQLGINKTVCLYDTGRVTVVTLLKLPLNFD